MLLAETRRHEFIEGPNLLSPAAWKKDVSWIMLPNPLMTQLLQSNCQPVRGGVQCE